MNRTHLNKLKPAFADIPDHELAMMDFSALTLERKFSKSTKKTMPSRCLSVLQPTTWGKP
jgi:hypothetical protein